MKRNAKRIVSFVAFLVMLASPCVLLSADANVPRVWYQKYSYDTNTISCYPLEISENTSVQSRILVGGESRYRSGNTSIVRLVVDKNNDGIIESWHGTGFIVGDNQIATCAHCIYKAEEKFASTHYYIPGLKVQMYDENGQPTSTLIDVEEVHIPHGHIDSFSRRNDYAMLTVATDLATTYGCFELGVACDVNSTDFSQINLFVTGIPQNLYPNGVETANNSFLIYSGTGREHPYKTSSNDVFYYTCDATDGNSGSPLYTSCRYTVGTESKVVNTVIGIHSGGDGEGQNAANEASPITSNKIQFYLNNPNIGY